MSAHGQGWRYSIPPLRQRGRGVGVLALLLQGSDFSFFFPAPAPAPLTYKQSTMDATRRPALCTCKRQTTHFYPLHSEVQTTMCCSVHYSAGDLIFHMRDSSLNPSASLCHATMLPMCQAPGLAAPTGSLEKRRSQNDRLTIAIFVSTIPSLCTRVTKALLLVSLID